MPQSPSHSLDPLHTHSNSGSLTSNSETSIISQSNVNLTHPSTALARRTSSAVVPVESTLSPWSESVQVVLEQPPSSLPLRLLLGGLIFCSLAVLWAWVGTLKDVSRAQGLLVPQGEVYRIQPAVNGEVTHIWVKEGQRVKEGQLLVELDQQLIQNEVERLEQKLITDRMQWSQLQGLIERTHAELNTRRAIAQAGLQAQASEIEQSRIEALTREATLTQLQSDLNAYEMRLARLRPLVEQGALAEEALFDVEQSLRDRQQAITQQQGQSELSRARIAQLTADRAQQQAEGQRQILEMQQKLQQLEIESSALQAKIEETQTALSKAHTEQDQTRLYAPVVGIVSSLLIQNAGEVLQPGTTIAEIAPLTAPLVLEAKLPSAEAGLVNVGMPVQIKFDAFPYQDYGVVSGKVMTISPDSHTDERLGAVYRLEIELDRLSVAHEGRLIDLQAGQTATAEIVVRQRRILDLIIEPFRKLQQGGINL